MWAFYPLGIQAKSFELLIWFELILQGEVPYEEDEEVVGKLEWDHSGCGPGFISTLSVTDKQNSIMRRWILGLP